LFTTVVGRWVPQRTYTVTVTYLIDIGRVCALALGSILLAYLIYGQARFRREYAYLYRQKDFWRYGHGDALNERHRIVELLLIASKGQAHYGLDREAQAFDNAARLAADPHLIDTMLAPDTVLPLWLDDYMADYRVRVGIFGRHTDTVTADG